MSDANATWPNPLDPQASHQGRNAYLAELHHRTRNILAFVHAMAHRTLASSTSLEDFEPRFEARLRALGRAQGLLAKADRESINLAELVRGELSAYGGTGKAQVEGPPVILPQAAVQPLVLALHELAANAAAHGALSQPQAELAVTWDVEQDEPGDGGGDAANAVGRRVRLAWCEGGVVMPGEGGLVLKGYGRELIEQALPYQLKAATRLEFGLDGVRCEVVFDLGELDREPHG